jgi:two-component system, OmpR family, phosphate regulon sensor histidine kinase PhoR
MDALLGITIIASIGFAYYGYHQTDKAKAQSQEIQKQDDVIKKLRAQLSMIERESAESKALFSTISNVAFDLVFLLDEDCIIIMQNKATELLFGDKNPIGEKLGDVIESSDLLNVVQHALNEQGSLEEQFVIDETYYRAKIQVMNYDGDNRFIGVAMQDITRLVHLNRARRDLVANISHELRTPITRIRLIIESLFHDAEKPKRKASIESLKEIAVETDTLLWLAQELLDLSMIESGQAIMRLIETPLKQVVDGAIERLIPQAETKQLTIVSHVLEEYDVLCDMDQLRRVLGNLIHNAIKWSPKNESITVTATASENDDEVTISVFDNGPGVPDDMCERIFERFYQVDASRSGHEGTGLGLAICKHIVEAHGGKIWAEGNSEGKGGHFLFTVLNADTDSDTPQSSDIDVLDQVSDTLTSS